MENNIKKIKIDKKSINSILVIIMTTFFLISYSFKEIYYIVFNYSIYITSALIIIFLLVNNKEIFAKNKKMFYLLIAEVILLFICKIFTNTGLGSIMQMIGFVLVLLELPDININKKALDILPIIIGICFIFYIFADKSYLNTNYAGYLYFCYYLFFVLIVEFKKSKLINVIYVIFTIFIAYCIMKTKCRTALITLIIANILLILPNQLYKKKWLQNLIAPIVTFGNLAVAYTYVWLWKNNFKINIFSFAQKSLYSGRNRIWNEIFDLILKNPLLGIGSHYNLESFPTYALHNSMLMIIATFGIPNFLIFFIFLINFIKKIITESMQAINRKKIYIVIISLFFIDFFESYLYWSRFNILFFIMIIYIINKNRYSKNESIKKETEIYIFEEGIDRMGGVERVISTLSNELVKKYTTNVISFYKTCEEPFFKYNENIRIKYLTRKKRTKGKEYYKNKLLYFTIRIIEEIKDRVYLPFKLENVINEIGKNDIVIFGRVDVALKSLKYIEECRKIIIRDAIHLEYQSEKNRKNIAKIFPNKVDLLIVSSDESMEIYKKYINCENINIEKIYNPLGIIPIQKCNKEAKTIISVGRYSFQKGYESLIKAFSIVNKEFPDWKLKIVGNNKNSNILTEQIKELKLEKSIILEDSSKDIVQQLNNASIFVMTSRYEGYANALVEAMACGLPCVSYNWLLGVNEIIEDGINGTIVELSNRYEYAKGITEKKDIINLANAIMELIKENEKYEKYSKNACKIINTRKPELILSKWIEKIEA